MVGVVGVDGVDGVVGLVGVDGVVVCGWGWLGWLFVVGVGWGG